MPTSFLFAGSDPIALPLLEFLLTQQQAQLVGILSQPDKPHGRGKELQPNAISAWALEQKIPLLRPEKPSETEVAWMRERNVELILVMAYGHIFRQNFLELPRLGMLNLHASLLPRYRGASPIETALAEGEIETGVCLMQMVKKMDAGGVAAIAKTRIEPVETGPSLRKKLAAAALEVVASNWNAILTKTLHFEEQDPSQATFTRKITKDDGWLDFHLPASVLERRIRAFIEWPGSFFQYNDTVIKVGEAQVLAVDTPTHLQPGTILAATSNGLDIATSNGILRLKQLQRPGGKMLPVDAFLRGFEVQSGHSIIGKTSVPLLSH